GIADETRSGRVLSCCASHTSPGSPVSPGTRAESPTPKEFHLKAQGRAAHPGGEAIVTMFPRRGYITAIEVHDETPSGYSVALIANPGCAARPWASRCNSFGVLKPSQKSDENRN